MEYNKQKTLDDIIDECLDEVTNNNYTDNNYTELNDSDDFTEIIIGMSYLEYLFILTLPLLGTICIYLIFSCF